MTSFFPDVNSKQIIKIIEELGFVFIRQSGSSHAVDERNTDCSANENTYTQKKKSLKRKTIKSICKDIGISLDELKELLR